MAGADLARATERIRELGGVILSFQVKAATYTLNVILPPGSSAARTPTLLGRAVSGTAA